MKGIVIFILLIVILLINGQGCELQSGNTPYFKEIYVDPSYIDSTTISSKVVYTIVNPSKLDFDGKIFVQYDKKCLRLSGELLISIELGGSKSGTILITKIETSRNNECFKDHQIILTLANAEGKLRYDTKTTSIKFIE